MNPKPKVSQTKQLTKPKPKKSVDLKDLSLKYRIQVHVFSIPRILKNMCTKTNEIAGPQKRGSSFLNIVVLLVKVKKIKKNRFKLIIERLAAEIIYTLLIR